MAGIVYVSIDDFSREGFTNGLFLQVRELLRRATARGQQASLACIAPRMASGVERRTRTVSGCTIHETFVAPPGKASAYRAAFRELLDELAPDVILLNTCAIQLTQAHHVVLRESLASGKRVVVLVTDQLYPTSDSHPDDEILRYYDLLRRTSVHAVSRTMAEAFQKQTGVPAAVLPNLLPEPQTAPTTSDETGRHLTLINHHPIKGRRVWDALIRQRPHDAYLVVETWPDVPPYTPPSPQVEIAGFAEDPSTIYNRTRILLVPSLGPEGLSRVTLETMESGVPVVAHHIGSLSELESAAVLVTPPPIVGYELDGGVLYPVVSPSDIRRAALDFNERIDALDHDASFRERCVNSGRALVRNYRALSEAAADQLLDTWFAGT
ncbi:glycosyltransferase [Sciscionella marina]|uniref:glycosyltransferase n=1 Tax=Sciscionella marina TaxID=508770 RepID=UPI0003821688|nr:glycosyltransferase [Sciscionella marina]